MQPNAIPAIPTRYAGVQFRSRLEARWAAMFDLLGWQWDYEPIDLAGYIPDFIISRRRPVLVEVRPIWGFCPETAQRVANSGWEGGVFMLGIHPKHRWVVDQIKPDSILDYGLLGDHNWRCFDFDYWPSHVEPADVRLLWREAGNRVQWKPAR
jgi:hypothetical protein